MADNYSILEKPFPELAEIGRKAECLYREGLFRECIQQTRQFAEGALKNVVRKERLGFADMLRDEQYCRHCDPIVHEAFRRIQYFGNSASHYPYQATLPGVPAKTTCPDRYSVVRTKDDARFCLSYCHEVTRWLIYLNCPGIQCPEFVEPDEVTTIHEQISPQKTVFDDAQTAVIRLAFGSHLVLAPPGCGKTAVLTERIAVAAEKGVPFSEMLCLTFTNRAARGMNERISQRFSGEESGIGECYVGNIHRFCSKFLFENEFVDDTAEILDEDESADIIQGILQEFEVGRKLADLDGPARSIVTYVQNQADRLYQKKNGYPEELIVPSFDEPTGKAVTEILRSYGLLSPNNDHCLNKDRIEQAAVSYLAYKEEQHLLDFNDLLFKAYETLSSRRDCRRYAWIQVDEIQDLSPLQLKIIDLLWEREKSYAVCVYFGDEQQAIYSFMGAKLSTLTDLQKICVVHRLHRNFRSPKYLLDVLNRFAVRELGCGAALLPTAEVESVAPTGALKLMRVPSPAAQRSEVAKLVKLTPADRTAAVLVNSNKEADEVSEILKNSDISHFKISGNDIFRYGLMKTAKAYLGVLTDDFRGLPWAHLVFRLSKKSDKSLKRIRSYLLTNLPRTGLLASDLMLYSEKQGPISYVEDFFQCCRGEMVVFDTETTGLEVGRDEVIQIAAVKLVNGIPTASKLIYLKTSRPIPKMLGRIPNPMVELYESTRDEHKDPEDGLREFLDFVGDAPVVGHNVEYDCNIVDSQFAVILFQAGLYFDVDRFRLNKRFDTLKLSYAFEHLICEQTGMRRLRSHKLKDLLAVLVLQGRNTHRADDDVEATISLLSWYRDHAEALIQKQHAVRSHPAVAAMTRSLRETFFDLYRRHKQLMYMPMDENSEAILVQVFREFIEALPNYTENAEQIENIQIKLPIVYRYLDRVLIDKKLHTTLYAQLHSYLLQINTLKEADLCSSEILDENIFVSTVHKAKGLEFDSVFVMDVMSGCYPFFRSRDSEHIVEDARKLYVALSRARRSLCLLYPQNNAWGYSTKPSPFLSSIKAFFEETN